MSTSTLRPGLTAAMSVGRALFAAGWEYDSTTPMVDVTSRVMLHPSGLEIEAITTGDGERTTLTMTGLSLKQAAGAVTGAGLTGPAETDDADPRQRLAAELHRIADDIARTDLPLGWFSSLHLGVLASRADLARWAGHLGHLIQVSNDGIPSISHEVNLGDRNVLTISVQSRREDRSEVERLRARVAELEAGRADGGEPR